MLRRCLDKWSFIFASKNSVAVEWVYDERSSGSSNNSVSNRLSHQLLWVYRCEVESNRMICVVKQRGKKINTKERSKIRNDKLESRHIVNPILRLYFSLFFLNDHLSNHKTDVMLSMRLLVKLYKCSMPCNILLYSFFFEYIGDFCLKPI